jgi:hypothetical protein
VLVEHGFRYLRADREQPADNRGNEGDNPSRRRALLQGFDDALEIGGVVGHQVLL